MTIKNRNNKMKIVFNNKKISLKKQFYIHNFIKLLNFLIINIINFYIKNQDYTKTPLEKSPPYTEKETVYTQKKSPKTKLTDLLTKSPYKLPTQLLKN